MYLPRFKLKVSDELNFLIICYYVRSNRRNVLQIQTLDEAVTCITIEAKRIQELIVDDMVLSETNSTLIVKTVTNDLKIALQRLTEPYVVVPFGSFINGLVCHGSDLDFYLGKL